MVFAWHMHNTAALCCIGQPGPPEVPDGFAFPWLKDPIEAFGGRDVMDPALRFADRAEGRFRPKGFVPRMNAFYAALPCNDLTENGGRKPEAAKIPWFGPAGDPKPGVSVLKGRWLHIFNGRVSCFARWEGCGPGTTDRWEDVFDFGGDGVRDVPPVRLGVSPAVRDFLKLELPAKVMWRFVDEALVPFGPWKPKPPPPGIV